MTHDQEKYEAYCSQDIIEGQPLLENCQCEDCQEETRILISEFIKHETNN